LTVTVFPAVEPELAEAFVAEHPARAARRGRMARLAMSFFFMD
jgi:hypothetical protein